MIEESKSVFYVPGSHLGREAMVFHALLQGVNGNVVKSTLYVKKYTQGEFFI